MKKKIMMLLFVIVVGILCSKNILQSHSLTPPVGNTGAPGETTCAQAGCHGGSGTGGVACTDSLIITSKYLGLQYKGTGVPTSISYMYSVTSSSGSINQYLVDTLTMTIKIPLAPIAGFQMTATAGSFMIVDTNTTQISVSNGKQYISHKNSTNGSNSWTFKWYPTSSTNPQFYFSTVCDTASINGGSGAGGSCVPGCTGSSSSSGGFGATSKICQFYGTSNIYLSPTTNPLMCVGDSIQYSFYVGSNSFLITYFSVIDMSTNNSILPLPTWLKSNQPKVFSIGGSWDESCVTPFAWGPNNILTKHYNASREVAFVDKVPIPKLPELWNCVNFGDTIGLKNPLTPTYPVYTIKYLWQPSAGLNDSTVYNPVATVNGTSKYILRILPHLNLSNVTSSGISSSLYSPSIQTNDRCITKDTQTIYVHQPSSASTSTTICKNESYLFNGNAYTTAGTFIDTLVNYVGCDSVTTLSLNVKTDEPISISGVVCKGGRFIFNKKMYDTSGIFIDTIFSNTSCDTVYTLTLSTAIIPVDTSVSVGNEMLIAHATNSTFQWYDCVNQNLVQGATDDTLLPPQSGYYAAIITTQPEMCSDTSACKFIFTTGINNMDELKQTKLFPNPAHDELKIQFSKIIKNGVIKILNLNGSELMNQTFNNKQVVQFSTKNLAIGIYVVEVQSGNSVWHQKLMKQ